MPNQRIVWRSKGEKGHVDGAVTFHELTPDLTRMLVNLEYYPQGFFERTGNLWRAQGRRARLELKFFRRYITSEVLLRQDEVEGWRGEIHDGEVSEEASDSKDQDSERQESLRLEGSRLRTPIRSPASAGQEALQRNRPPLLAQQRRSSTSSEVIVLAGSRPAAKKSSPLPMSHRPAGVARPRRSRPVPHRQAAEPRLRSRRPRLPEAGRDGLWREAEIVDNSQQEHSGLAA